MSETKTKPQKRIVQDGLAAWLADPRADEFFGQAFGLKMAVLAEVSTDDRRNVAAVLADRLAVDRKRVAVHVRAARRIYGIPTPTAKKLRQS